MGDPAARKLSLLTAKGSYRTFFKGAWGGPVLSGDWGKETQSQETSPEFPSVMKKKGYKAEVTLGM